MICMNSSRAKQAQEVRENTILEKLVRAMMEQKIQQKIIHIEVVAALGQWFRGILIGPVLPLNKEKNFLTPLYC